MAFSNLEETMNSLKEMGVSKVEIEYLGSGDDGAIEPPDFHKTDKLKTLPDGFEEEAGDTLVAFVEHLLGPGWENGMGLQGKLIFNVETGVITHNQEEETANTDYTTQIFNSSGELLTEEIDSWYERVATEIRRKDRETHGEQASLEVQLGYINSIEQALSHTKFKRFMCEFWVEYPTITSVTWGTWIRDTGLKSEVTQLTFISEEAENEFAQQIADSISDGQTSFTRTTFTRSELNLFLFSQIYIDLPITEEYRDVALTRPEDPTKDLQMLLCEVYKALDHS